jgi:hypothetical protein
MNLPDIPEYVANYFNFIIDFAASPKETCSRYKATNSVNKDLLAFAAIGTAFTWLTLVLLKKIAELNNDKSSFLRIVDYADADTITLITLPCIIILTLLVHLAVKIIFFFNKKIYKQKIKGTINFKNTVNGSLAFFSFAPFVFMLCFLFTMLGAYQIKDNSSWPIFLLLLFPLVILEGFFIFWYLPASLSAVQPDELSSSYRKAIFSVYGLIIFLVAAQSWIKDIFS